MTFSTGGPNPTSVGEQSQDQDVPSLVDVSSHNGDSILVQQTSRKSWVVRHAPVPDCAGSLIGCVEERDGFYEVMRINDGFQWHNFMTLDDAIQNLARLAHARAASSPADLFSPRL
jgi:hypothetical protein